MLAFKVSKRVFSPQKATLFYEHPFYVAQISNNYALYSSSPAFQNIPHSRYSRAISATCGFPLSGRQYAIPYWPLPPLRYKDTPHSGCSRAISAACGCPLPRVGASTRFLTGGRIRRLLRPDAHIVVHRKL